jgi:hypothetical protein
MVGEQSVDRVAQQTLLVGELEIHRSDPHRIPRDCFVALLLAMTA